MAPRGKPRKVGLRRIDAAIDALIPYGFSKKLITKNINKLLEVYGGDNGWAFIEDASYRLLIETILEHNDESEIQAPYPVEHQDGSCKLPIKTILVNDDNSEVKAPDSVEHQDRVKYQEMQQVSTGGQSDHGPSQPVKEMQQVPCGGRPAAFIEASEDLRHSQPAKVDEAEKVTRSPRHMGVILPTTRRRPPLYGWLSESEDEVLERNRRRSRKSRWDVGPSV